MTIKKDITGTIKELVFIVVKVYQMFLTSFVHFKPVSIRQIFKKNIYQVVYFSFILFISYYMEHVRL